MLFGSGMRTLLALGVSSAEAEQRGRESNGEQQASALHRAMGVGTVVT